MRVLAIVGPTAAGKSGLARDVARAAAAAKRPVEVVAVDAFTVYRGMDLGTAKPSEDERRRIPHHMIDVLDPSEEVNVAWFQRHARAAIDDVDRRGATPLLVGGSGLYWRAVVDDLEFPPTDPHLRAAIERRWRHDPHAAHARLRGLDPRAADRIEPTNLRRTVRALEVVELTGRGFSEFRTSWDDYHTVYGELRVVVVDPDDAELRAAIDRRSRRMVDAGLVEEARELAGGRPLSRTAAQAIGYAEALAVIDGRLAPEALAAAIAQRTWRYARRQRSWFRRDPRGIRVRGADELSAVRDHLTID